MLPSHLPPLLLLPLLSAGYSPSQAWDAECNSSFKELGVYNNFSLAVAHTLHSITIEDIFFFFGVQLKEDNENSNDKFKSESEK